MKADWGAAFRGADQVDGRSLATLREAAPPIPAAASALEDLLKR
ncbi:hypothetical protein ABIE89_007350 [Bradyrhizobium niftali]